MINAKRLSIDFSKIKTIGDFHDEMNELFGFPDFYGKNVHALIDCLSSIRFPSDGMTKIHVDMCEVLIIEAMNFSVLEKEIMKIFIFSVEAVNQRSILKGRSAPLLIEFIEKHAY
ncbi:barstar family protein [Winslowiella iniecta]|uniref:barstar family protein n=1 Tax=Winslowiella iniecta TaxID=1560201 RepID=UPI000B17B28F|nr:barstar family protein [Winslowiella iniecta]